MCSQGMLYYGSTIMTVSYAIYHETFVSGMKACRDTFQDLSLLWS